MPRPKGSKNGRRNLVAITCETCGCVFEVEPWEVKRNRKHCSNACRNKFAGLSHPERAKVRRRQLKEQGLCIDCANKASDGRVRCDECREKRRSSCKKWVEKNQDVVKANRVKYRRENRDKLAKYGKQYRREYRNKTLDLYGGKCACCGEGEKDFLQFDHINGDGKQHRKDVGRSMKLLRDLYNNHELYKDRIRVLCANCHFAITSYGECPHVRQIS